MKLVNRDDYINNYELTQDEFCLLPQNLRLAYLHTKFSSLLEKVTFDKPYVSRGYIQPVYFEYFKFCGYKVQNFDFGIEEIEIKKQFEIDYKPTDEEIKTVNEFVKFIAKTRWIIFSNAIKTKLKELSDNVDIGEIDLDVSILKYSNYLYSETSMELSEYQEYLSLMLQYILEKDYIGEMSYFLSGHYREQIIKQGYEIEELGETIKIRKLQ